MHNQLHLFDSGHSYIFSFVRSRKSLSSFIVYTSDVSGAGTDADVFIVLYGREGMMTQKTSLCATKDERKSKFNKKSVDTVRICESNFFSCFKPLYIASFRRCLNLSSRRVLCK